MENNIELMAATDVAKLLRTTNMKVKSGILNGTLPIGAVLTGDTGQDRVIIVAKRFWAWVNAEDLSLKQ